MRYVTSNFPFALQPIVRWVGEPGLSAGYSGDPLSPRHDPGQEDDMSAIKTTFNL